eukprot:3840594-Amphidinium_carterae.1
MNPFGNECGRNFCWTSGDMVTKCFAVHCWGDNEVHDLNGKTGDSLPIALHVEQRLLESSKQRGVHFAHCKVRHIYLLRRFLRVAYHLVEVLRSKFSEAFAAAALCYPIHAQPQICCGHRSQTHMF